MRQVGSFIILTAAATVVACATQPPASPASPVPARPAVAAQPAKPNFHSGYVRVVASDGTEVFCRDDMFTGSRVEHQKVCLTAEQLQRTEEAGQDYIHQTQSSTSGALAGAQPTYGGYYSPGAGKP
jgi:hypothetical protein